MNIEAKASHDALGPSQRSTADRRLYNYDSTKDKLLADLKVVVTDSRQLIREVADSSVEGFATARTRFERKLDETRARIDRTRAAVGETAQTRDRCHACLREGKPVEIRRGLRRCRGDIRARSWPTAPAIS